MSKADIHLLVLVHGMWGNPGHLAEMQRIILETRGAGSSSRKDGDMPLEVLVAHSNAEESTYDGIDWGGERIADEVVKKVKELEGDGKTTVRFSIIGYSLGGLLARYVVGILRTRHFFNTIKPINFTTIATPHIGLIRTGSIFTAVAFKFGPRLLSRTGEQFYCVDEWAATGKPLIEVMSDPKEIFYQSLMEFPHVHIYGNTCNDLTVPYATALIDTRDPFADRSDTGIDVEFDPKYEPVMLSYSIPNEPPKKEKSPTVFSPTWFREFKINNYLPPFLQSLKFPLNAVALISLPVLMPTFFVLALVRLSTSSRSSRKRIKLLEGDESLRENALVHAFARLESEIERAVVDAIEDNQGGHPTAPRRTRKTSHANGRTEIFDANGDSVSSSTSSTTHIDTETNTDPEKGNKKAKKSKPKSGQPVLSASQLRMVEHLNTLPQMHKHYVFIDPVRNSHATIIARDVKNFDFHKRGWGVLRHWADGFVL